MEAVRTTGLTNQNVPRCGGWRRFTGSIIDNKAPETLPAATHDLDCKFVFSGRSQVVNHEIEVGGVAMIVSRLFLASNDWSVAHYVIAGVRYELVPGKSGVDPSQNDRGGGQDDGVQPHWRDQWHGWLEVEI